MKEKTIKNVTHRVYDSIKEFSDNEESDAVIEDWREAEYEDWMLTDDGQVCQVLYKGEMQPSRAKNKIPYIRTLLGTYLQTDAVEIRGDIPKDIYSFSNNKTAEEIIRNRKEPTRWEKVFAFHVARGMEQSEAYLKAFPTENEGYATLMATKLMRTDRVQGAIREEIELLLDNAGVSKTQLIQSANRIAQESDKDATQLRAIEYLLGLFGISPKQEKQSEAITLFQGFTKEQIKKIEAGGDARIQKVEAKIDSG